MGKIELYNFSFKDLSKNRKSDINKVLDMSERATIFHSIEWNEVLYNVFGIRSDIILARSEDKPVGFYQLYHTKKYKIIDVYKSPNPSLECVYGGPIAIKESENAIGYMIDESERVAEGAVLSIQTPPGYDIGPFRNRGYNTAIFQTSIIDLQKNDSTLWEGIDRKTRNLVRKAEKNDLTVIDGDESYIEEYYELVSETFSKSNGPRLLPVDFYKSIISNLKPKSMARFRVVKHDERLIAGAIFLCYKENIYFWSGASSHKHRNLAPNNLIQWDILRWARDEGYKYYDLVRIEPDRLPGIAKFKEGWGGKSTDFYYAFKISGVFKELYKLRSILWERKNSWASSNQY